MRIRQQRHWTITKDEKKCAIAKDFFSHNYPPLEWLNSKRISKIYMYVVPLSKIALFKLSADPTVHCGKKAMWLHFYVEGVKKIIFWPVFKMKSRIPWFFLPFEDDLWCHCWRTNVYNIILVLYCYPQFDRILTIPMYSNGLDYLYFKNKMKIEI